MKSIDSERLSLMIKSKKLEEGLSLRSTAKEIGISAPTLSRIEQGNVPDMNTYIKICTWLEVPVDFFTQDSGSFKDTQKNIVASLRADKTLPPETSKALINMINLAYNQIKGSN